MLVGSRDRAIPLLCTKPLAETFRTSDRHSSTFKFLTWSLTFHILQVQTTERMDEDDAAKSVSGLVSR